MRLRSYAPVSQSRANVRGPRADSTPTDVAASTVYGLLEYLLPELRSLPRHEQARAWAAARQTEFEASELFGIAAAVVLTTVLTRYALPDGSTWSRVAAILLNVGVALPLLVVTTGPLQLRRIRRGLRAWRRRRTPA